jgi:hypothetical protein
VDAVEVVVAPADVVVGVVDVVDVVAVPSSSAAADEIVAAATPELANTTAVNSVTLRRLSSEFILIGTSGRVMRERANRRPATEATTSFA